MCKEKRIIPAVAWELTHCPLNQIVLFVSDDSATNPAAAAEQAQAPGEPLLTLGTTCESYQSQGSGSSLLPGQESLRRTLGMEVSKTLEALASTWMGLSQKSPAFSRSETEGVARRHKFLSATKPHLFSAGPISPLPLN